MIYLSNIDLSKNQLQNAVIHPLGTAPSSPVEGQIYYNSSSNEKKMYIWDGGNWIPVGDITKITSTESRLIVTNGTTNEVSLSLDIATVVANGGTGLVTADLLYDYIVGLDFVSSVSPGNGITVTGTAADPIINHADTSSVSNLSASARTYVTGLTFDTYGHVTGFSTGTETVVDTNTTYTLTVTDGPTNDANINLVAGGSGSGTVSANIVGTDDQILIGVTAGSLKIGFTQDVIMPRHLTVLGDLTVSGTVTTVNTETINLADNIITLNSNATGTPTENAGIEVERGSAANVFVRWNETTDRWEFTNDGTTYFNLGVASDSGYAESLSSPVLGEYTITHNLNSTDVIVQLISLASGETIYADVVRLNVNQILVTFASQAPGGVRVLVSKIG